MFLHFHQVSFNPTRSHRNICRKNGAHKHTQTDQVWRSHSLLSTLEGMSILILKLRTAKLFTLLSLFSHPAYQNISNLPCLTILFYYHTPQGPKNIETLKISLTNKRFVKRTHDIELTNDRWVYVPSWRSRKTVIIRDYPYPVCSLLIGGKFPLIISRDRACTTSRKK